MTLFHMARMAPLALLLMSTTVLADEPNVCFFDTELAPGESATLDGDSSKANDFYGTYGACSDTTGTAMIKIECSTISGREGPIPPERMFTFFYLPPHAPEGVLEPDYLMLIGVPSLGPDGVGGALAQSDEGPPDIPGPTYSFLHGYMAGQRYPAEDVYHDASSDFLGALIKALDARAPFEIIVTSLTTKKDVAHTTFALADWAPQLSRTIELCGSLVEE